MGAIAKLADVRASLLILVSISHLLASLGFWRSIISRRIPNMIDCACLSIIVYYDVGIWLEWTGFDFPDPYLSTMREANDVNFTICAIVLLFMPWLLRLGGLVASGGAWLQPVERELREFRHRQLFYVLAIVTTVILAITGADRIMRGLQLWEIRKEMSEWGVLVVLLYVPIHFLAYYIFQSDSKTAWGTGFVIWLIVSGIVSTLILGERTNTLIPFVVAILFWLSPRLKVIVPVVVVLVIAAALSLPVFKSGYATSNKTPVDLLMLTVYTDFSRTETLTTAVSLSEPIGTRILPYPGAGYVYSLLFFIPRSLVPWKGEATTNWFTGQVSGSVPTEMDWGFGIGAAEELLLNFGIAFVGPGFFVYGVAMGLIDRFSRGALSLVVPTRLAALFICGYNLPSLLLMYGTMALFVFFLDRVFSISRDWDEESQASEADLSYAWPE